MKIDSIKTNPSGAPVKLKHKDYNALEYRSKSVEECKQITSSVTRENYGGSFTGINRAAACVMSAATEAHKAPREQGLADKIYRLCNAHTVIASSLVALVLGAVFRPITIVAMSDENNKGNSAYAAGHAISSAVIGFIASSILMTPLGDAVKKTRKNIEEISVLSYIDKNPEELSREQVVKLDDIKDRFGVTTSKELKEKLFEKFKIKDLKDIENIPIVKKFKKTYNLDSIMALEKSKEFEKVTKVLDMAPDTFVFGILKAMLTIALIPPILKYVFGIEKGKKPEQKPVQAPQPQTAQEQLTVQTPKMEQFMGGLK